MSKTLSAAVAAAQLKMKNANLNKVNPHFKSPYADLAGIRDAVIPAFAEQGVAVVQLLDQNDNGDVLVTKLIMGAEEIVSTCPIIVDNKRGPQPFGSALTYARRYSLAAIAGISADEDDDGNSAQENTDQSMPPAKGKKAPAKKAETQGKKYALKENGKVALETDDFRELFTTVRKTVYDQPTAEEALQWGNGIEITGMSDEEEGHIRAIFEKETSRREYVAKSSKLMVQIEQELASATDTNDLNASWDRYNCEDAKEWSKKDREKLDEMFQKRANELPDADLNDE